MVKRSTRKGSSRQRKKTGQQRRDAQQTLAKATVAASLQPPKPPEPPSGFTHNYGPGILLAHGPLVMAFWSVPQVVQDFLQTQGVSIPRPVQGALLLDTGATGTCISIRAADRLGLKPTRLVAGFGAGGATNNPVYQARLCIPIANPNGTGVDLIMEQEVQGIPELEKHLQGKPLTYSGNSIELIGLLGRDVLASTRFVYDGLAGTLHLNFDRTAIDFI